MCGILGIIAPWGVAPSITDEQTVRMRDTMVHRGPDGAGLWRRGNALLAHRRLSVLDTTDAAHQPMVTPEGRFALVYNGELYNEPDLRAHLASSGIVPRSRGDTETLLHLLAREGEAAVDRLRGMYAFGFYDALSGDLVLARDPLGIKPLYYGIVRTPTGQELVFASEPAAILTHPHASARPDIAVVSSYLTTIRTTLGSRTLFEGVSVLRPGEVVRVRTRAGGRAERLREPGVLTRRGPVSEPDVGAVVARSVRAHLRSDVPLCCLLSGGLDSTIVASVAHLSLGSLHTFCAGAAGAVDDPDLDFGCARLVASRLGTAHTEAPVDAAMFRERWASMVARTGLPLSTPNEVAINEVARVMRARGMVVTLSGEGADELFGGYELPMRQAAAFEAGTKPDARADAAVMARARAEFQIDSNAWVARSAKPAVLSAGALAAAEGDAALLDEYTATAEACEREPGGDGLAVHLTFHRRVNLLGLLQRLDSATMLESVEGRTPLADAEVAAMAESLPMHERFDAAAIAPGGVAHTKIALRRAFADAVPARVLTRPKASFPLPFQEWMGESDGVLGPPADAARGPLAAEVFRSDAMAQVLERPRELWNIAWPVLNIALWGRRWWG